MKLFRMLMEREQNELSVQPCEHENQGKYDSTACQPGQSGQIPLRMPGIFSGEKIKDYCYEESNCPGDEQEYPGNIVPGLVELTQVPAVTRKDDGRNSKR